MKTDELKVRCLNSEQFKNPIFTYRKGKNELMYNSLNESTKLIIVGTFIPNIPFFYTNKQNITYEKIDSVCKTNLNEINKKIQNTNDSIKVKEFVQELIDELNKIGIAFFDVINEAYVFDRNGSKDSNIVYATIDLEMIEKIKKYQDKNIIVAASEFAKDTLKQNGIREENIFYPNNGLINGRNNDWEGVLRKYLTSNEKTKNNVE